MNAIVTKITQLCHDTKSFILKPKKEISFKPGQYIMQNIPVGERRAYSIASNKEIELCVNNSGGIGSDYLFKLKEGDLVSFDGPYGSFGLTGSTLSKFFIATGTGIGPLRAMLLELLEKGAKETIYLFFGERTEEEILYKQEFDALERKYANFKFIPTLSRPVNGWKGEKGHVQDSIAKYLNKNKKIEAYVCGLRAMIESVSKELQKAGISSIVTERYN